MRRGLFSLVWLAAVWPAGAYIPRTLTADAGFATHATNTFTNNLAQQTASILRDQSGNIQKRVWRNPDGSTNLIELFYWDAKDRLTDFFSYDRARNGFYWHAEYDGLNRRLLTKCYVTTNGLTQIEGVTPTTINQYYDPEVEFLELGVAYGNSTEWKLYGPDLNGKYGGLNGVGGLDAVSPYLNTFTPVISDYRGNILGEATNGAVAWNPSRPTGYGAVPGYRPVALAHGADVAQSSAWRGRWVDVTGYYNLGLRLYDPVGGMWLSYDSTWNARDPNYLTFCGGDPINGFDADGRLAKDFYNYEYYGAAAGYALNGIGNALNSYSGNNVYLGAYSAYLGTLFNEAGGAVSPSTYVNGLTGFGNNVSTIYNDSGFMPAASYAISGWNVGKVYSGFANLNLVTGQPVGDWWQRGESISGGVGATAGIAAGGLGIYNWATAAPASSPPVIPTTGEVLGPEGPGQFVWRPGLGRQETATVVRQGEFVNRMYDSGYTPGAGVSGPMGSSFAPGSGVPTTAAEGIQGRGLGLFYPNNAQQAIIYQATENIPAMSRTSIGGTTPEIVIQPANFPSLQPVQQFPVIPANTRPWP